MGRTIRFRAMKPGEFAATVKDDEELLHSGPGPLDAPIGSWWFTTVEVERNPAVLAMMDKLHGTTPQAAPRPGFRYEDEPDNRDALCAIDFTKGPGSPGGPPRGPGAWERWLADFCSVVSFHTGVDTRDLLPGSGSTVLLPWPSGSLFDTLAERLIAKGYDVWDGVTTPAGTVPAPGFRVYAPAPPGYHGEHDLVGRSP